MTMRLDIASPKEVSFSEKVEMAVMPGLDGDIAAQPGHVQTMLSLRPGVISIQKEGGKLTPLFFVSGGFADIGPEETTILADKIRPLSELSEDSAQERLSKAMEVMSSVVNTGTVHEDHHHELRVAQAELAAVKHHLDKK